MLNSVVSDVIKKATEDMKKDVMLAISEIVSMIPAGNIIRVDDRSYQIVDNKLYLDGRDIINLGDFRDMVVFNIDMNEIMSACKNPHINNEYGNEILRIKEEARLTDLKLQKVSLELMQDIVELDKKILETETGIKVSSLEKLSKIIDKGCESK